MNVAGINTDNNTNNRGDQTNINNRRHPKKIDLL